MQANTNFYIEVKSVLWLKRLKPRQRKREHQGNLKNYSNGFNVANHVWQNNHSIDFDNACVIDKGNYRFRKTLESWHTAKTVDATNLTRIFAVALLGVKFKNCYCLALVKVVTSEQCKGHFGSFGVASQEKIYQEV